MIFLFRGAKLLLFFDITKVLVKKNALKTQFSTYFQYIANLGFGEMHKRAYFRLAVVLCNSAILQLGKRGIKEARVVSSGLFVKQ